MGHRSAALMVVVVCLGINLVILAGIAIDRPEYLRDAKLTSNPDARHYVVLGYNLLHHGYFSRSDHPPYLPDILRTPVFPLFVGVLDLAGGGRAIYLAHMLLHAGSCYFLFLITQRAFGNAAACCASLLLATDLMLAITNFTAMSEPLFIFLLLASIHYLLGGLPPAAGEGRWKARTVVGGVLLSLAILTRPAALYLFVVYAGLFLALGLRDRRLLPALGRTFLLGCVVALPVGLWVLRNYWVFSVPKVTTADVINLNYFAGAGPYQIEHGVSLEEAQEMIAREFGLTPVLIANNDFLSDRSVSEINAELNSAWPKVLFKYPRALAISSLLGLAKASVSHNTGEFADMLGKKWVAPGTGSLLRLQSAALQRSGRNGPWLSAVFGWQLFHVVLMLGLALPGLVLALRHPPSRLYSLALLAIAAYFTLTVAIVGLEAYHRSRIPVVPLLDVFAGYGLVRSVCGLVDRSPGSRGARPEGLARDEVLNARHHPIPSLGEKN